MQRVTFALFVFTFRNGFMAHLSYLSYKPYDTDLFLALMSVSTSYTSFCTQPAMPSCTFPLLPNPHAVLYYAQFEIRTTR